MLATVANTLNYAFFEYWEENWDPRTRDYAFARGGILPILFAMSFYAYFSKKIGPELMKNRKPFELRNAMLFYNITTVLMNAYFFLVSLYYLNFGIELFNFKFPERNIKEVSDFDKKKVNLVFFYVLTKLYDLLDTMFFVLRKKNNQITGRF